MKIKKFKENLWTSTRLKLDIIASIFVFFVLFSFSFVVYNLLTQDIIFQISPVFKYLESKESFDTNQFFNDLQNQTLFLLIVSDILIFIISMFFFDRMVKKMLKPIEYVTDLQKRFASNVSHELRTPLSIMNMRGEILMSKIEKEEAKEDSQNAKFISEAKDGTQVILKEITNLTEIIDDLLFEARIKYSDNKIENISIKRIENIIKKSFNNQKYLKSENVEFKIENYNFEENLYIKANPLHLERIFNNLISNSFKFTNTGEVNICFEKYKYNNDYLKIIIKDTGSGISHTDLPKITERFYRGKAKENEVSGTGIGLSIVKDIIHNYKWNFDIKSKEGNGTIIEIGKISLY